MWFTWGMVGLKRPICVFRLCNRLVLVFDEDIAGNFFEKWRAREGLDVKLRLRRHGAGCRQEVWNAEVQEEEDGVN